MQDATSLIQILNKQLLALQETTPAQPYSILHRLKLAKAYRVLGYPDLAAGDAYKGLLLADEIIEEGEYYVEAIEAARADACSEYLSQLNLAEKEEEYVDEDDRLKTLIKNVWRRDIFEVFIQCLLDCGCLRSAAVNIARARKAFPSDNSFEQSSRVLSEKLHAYSRVNETAFDEADIESLPDRCLVRRESYAWNVHEPDRFSPECLQVLNAELQSIAPKLEVKSVKLPLLGIMAVHDVSSKEIQLIEQLGIFAKEDIPPGEQILEERSLLTAISRLHDMHCDACSAKLPQTQNDGLHDASMEVMTCEDCNEVYFCNTECHDLAQAQYHSPRCDISHDGRNIPASEDADALYCQLVTRALALAESQMIHPLELKEIRYIWGDYVNAGPNIVRNLDQDHLDAFFRSIPRTLPFSFQYNVLTPLHELEQMDINIFTESSRYDTWVMNILYAKIRGTASAQQGLDGRPEIAAVHPIWCLANHSCNPNVEWEWQGSMKFWAREHLIDWKGRSSKIKPGLRKGEEVLSHYCDINLPVQERREWALGALGGPCQCERCSFEATDERPKEEVQ